MTGKASSHFSDLIESAGEGWNRFWFTPSDPLPCAILRIGVGVLVALHLALLTTQLDRWYATGGVLSTETTRTVILGDSSQSSYHISYFDFLRSTRARIAHFLAIAVAVAFAAGVFSRITGPLTLVALLNYF